MEELSPISKVYGIFSDFFGEENVDLQGQIILVHFPKVTVTNENNRSVDITHLWVRVGLSYDGTMSNSFKMMRSELTDKQAACGYSHSHINSVHPCNFKEWRNPCLGSGPIRDTIASLCSQFSEEMWSLFCLELSKYVTVESLSGVPYMYLEKIGVRTGSDCRIIFPLDPLTDNKSNPILNSFVEFLISKKPFGFNFFNGSYGIAMSDRNIFITLSNLFIEFNNSLPANLRRSLTELTDAGILYKGKIVGNNFYYSSDSNFSFQEWNSKIGEPLFEFKGNTVHFNIIRTNRSTDIYNNEILLLSTQFVSTVIARILRLINNKYGKNNQGISSRETHIYA